MPKNILVYTVDSPKHINNNYGLGNVISNVYSNLKYNNKIVSNTDNVYHSYTDRDVVEYWKNFAFDGLPFIDKDTIFHSHDTPANIPIETLKTRYYNAPWIHSFHIQLSNPILSRLELGNVNSLVSFDDLLLHRTITKNYAIENSSIIREMELQTYKTADYIIFHSSYMQEQFERYFGEYVDIESRRRTTFIIPNGYDDSVFKPVDKVVAKENLVKIGLDFKKKVIFYYGRFTSQKNVDALFNLGVSKHIAENYIVVLVGNNTISSAVTDVVNGLTVVQLPKLQQTLINDLLNTCEYCVLPSYYEPFGQTALESIASGAITIVPSGLGFDEFCNKFNSYSMKGNSVYDIVTAIKELDDNLQLKDSLRNRGGSVSRFTWTNVLKHYEFIYENAKPLNLDYSLIKKEKELNFNIHKIDTVEFAKLYRGEINKAVLELSDNTNILELGSSSDIKSPLYECYDLEKTKPGELFCNTNLKDKSYETVYVSKALYRTYFPFSILREGARISANKLIINVSNIKEYGNVIGNIDVDLIKQFLDKIGFKFLSSKELENGMNEYINSILLFERV